MVLLVVVLFDRYFFFFLNSKLSLIVELPQENNHEYEISVQNQSKWDIFLREHVKLKSNVTFLYKKALALHFEYTILYEARTHIIYDIDIDTSTSIII